MSKEPTCPLCQGRMALERTHGLLVTLGTQHVGHAWVCVQCSAAFPVAIGRRGIFSPNPEPLYVDGVRINDRPPPEKS
jgi:hypothetical protein